MKYLYGVLEGKWMGKRKKERNIIYVIGKWNGKAKKRRS